MATLAYTIDIEGLGDDALVVTQFDGQESLSASVFHHRPCYGFCYQITLASRRHDLTADQVVDRQVELRMYRNQVLVQRVHGIARAFTQGNIGHHHTRYALTLVPALERLSLRHNSRIFQHKTTPDIIETLLQEMGIHDYAFSLQREPAQREFCVQYRESDLDFLHRLAAEEGMVYSFIHEAGKHTLLFSDATVLLPSLPQPIPYNGLAGGVSDVPYIQDFSYQSEAHVSEVELKDYSFKNPAYSFSQLAHGTEMDYQQPTYVHFDAPGRYKGDPNGIAFTRTRLSYLRRDAQLAKGKSNELLLRSGYKFTLSDHLNTSFNRAWLLVQVNHQGEQAQALEEEGTQGKTTYANQWQAIPAHLNWQAQPETKPRVDGPMIATVVGPEGEEIFCDEHGRVKVHFHWDREERNPEHRSCWVRVSQGWAGSQYGMVALPRIGHEVIVSFLNGDPDQPIITGRTYHAVNKPPYVLPNHKTRTVLKTQTHQGKGSNELRFEDQADQEQIYLHAQKDKDVVINHISRESVGLDFHQKIGQHFFQMVTENTHRLVGKNVTEEFGQDHHYKVGRNLVQRVIGAVNRFISGGMVTKIEGGSVTSMSASEEKEIGANQRIAVNNESYLNATNIVLEAKQELTIKGPGGFVKIDGGGITISGNVVKINEGGSPGSGTAPKAVEPQPPAKPQEPDDPDRRL